jgi:hypothetical protein
MWRSRPFVRPSVRDLVFATKPFHGYCRNLVQVFHTNGSREKRVFRENENRFSDSYVLRKGSNLHNYYRLGSDSVQ